MFNPKKIFTRMGSEIIKKTQYPPIVRSLINISPIDVHISGSDLNISRNCGFSGDILLGSGTMIERNCGLYGEIKTGPHVCIREDTRLNGSIKVGRRSRLQKNVDVTGNVSFGKYSAVGRRSTFISRNHPTTRPSIQFNFNREVIDKPLSHISKGPIKIGSDVWIGAEAMVLSGVNIGDGAVIGGGSVVANDVPPYAIAVGSPAKVRSWRFDEQTRNQLLDIKWWDWDEDMIQHNREFFSTDLTDVEDVQNIIKYK